MAIITPNEPTANEYQFTIDGQSPDVMTGIGTFNEVEGTFTGNLWNSLLHVAAESAPVQWCGSDASQAWNFANATFYNGAHYSYVVGVENIPVTLYSTVVPIPEPPALVDNLVYEEIRAGDDISFDLTQDSPVNPYYDATYAAGFVLVWNPATDGDLVEIRLVSETKTYVHIVDSNGEVDDLSNGPEGSNTFTIIRFNPADYAAPVKIVASTWDDRAVGSFQLNLTAPNAVVITEPEILPTNNNNSSRQFLASGGFLQRNFLGNTQEESLLKLIDQSQKWCEWNKFPLYFERDDFSLVGKNDQLPYSNQKLRDLQSTLLQNDRLAVLKSGYYFEKTTEPFVIGIRTWHGSSSGDNGGGGNNTGFVFDEDYDVRFTEMYKEMQIENIPSEMFVAALWRTTEKTVIERPGIGIAWIGKSDDDAQRPGFDLESYGEIPNRQGSVRVVRAGRSDIDPISLFVSPEVLYEDSFKFCTWPVIEITFGETWKFPINKRLSLIIHNVPVGDNIDLLTTDFTTGIVPIFATNMDGDSGYSSPQLELTRTISDDLSRIVFSSYIPFGGSANAVSIFLILERIDVRSSVDIVKYVPPPGLSIDGLIPIAIGFLPSVLQFDFTGEESNEWSPYTGPLFTDPPPHTEAKRMAWMDAVDNNPEGVWVSWILWSYSGTGNPPYTPTVGIYTDEARENQITHAVYSDGKFYTLVDVSTYTIQGGNTGSVGLIKSSGICAPIADLSAHWNNVISPNWNAYPVYCYGDIFVMWDGERLNIDSADRCSIVSPDETDPPPSGVNTLTLNDPILNLAEGTIGGNNVIVINRVLTPNSTNSELVIWVVENEGFGWMNYDFELNAYYDQEMTRPIDQNGDGGWYYNGGSEFYLVLTFTGGGNAFLARVVDDSYYDQADPQQPADENQILRAGSNFNFDLTTASTLNPYREGRFSKEFELVWNPASDGDIALIRLLSPTDAYLQLVDASGQIVMSDDDSDGSGNSRLQFFIASYAAPLKVVATTYSANATGNFNIVVDAPNKITTTYHWSVGIPDSDIPVKSLDNAVCEAALMQWVFRTHGIGAPNIDGAPNHLDRVRNITRTPDSLVSSYTLRLEVWTDPADPTYDSVYQRPQYNGFNYQYQLSYSFSVNRVEGMIPAV
jgi:hypothetical protein